MRKTRIAVPLATLFGALALVPAAFGVTSVQLNYRLGQMVTGVPLSGGADVQVYITDTFHWSRAAQRRVVNDCSVVPQPQVGYWFFHPTTVVALGCNGRPIIGVKGVLPRDYDITSRHAIYSACRSFRREAHHQPKGQKFHVPCAYRHWDTYDGTVTRDVLIKDCHGNHSTHRLRAVVYKPNRLMQRVMCSGRKYPPNPWGV